MKFVTHALTYRLTQSYIFVYHSLIASATKSAENINVIFTAEIRLSP